MVDDQTFRLRKEAVAFFIVVIDGGGPGHLAQPSRPDHFDLLVVAKVPEVVVRVLPEGLRPGQRIGVVRAPAALHERILSAHADLGQEGSLRPGLHDDVDVIAPQQVLQLPLHQQRLLPPARGGGVVGHQDLDGKGHACGAQLLPRGVPISQSRLRGKAVPLRQVRQRLVGREVLSPCHGGPPGRDGVVQKQFRTAGLVHPQRIETVQPRHQRLPEVLADHSFSPVVRLIGGVKLRIEIEHIEIGPGIVRPALVDFPGHGRIGQRRFQICRVNHGPVDLSVQIPLPSVFCGVRGVPLGDDVDMYVLYIPISGIFREDVLSHRLELREDIRAVVQQILFSRTDPVPLLLQKGAVHREIRCVGQNAQEKGTGLLQRVNQRVVVRGPDADLACLHLSRNDVVGFRVEQIVCVVEIVLRLLHHRTGGIHVLDRGVVRGIVDVLGGGDPVVGGHGGVGVPLPVIPADPRTDVKGPLRHGVVGFPALRQAGKNIAVGVVIHQGVDQIRAERGIHGGIGDQIVQRLHLGGVLRMKGHALLHREGDVVAFSGFGVRSGTPGAG